MPNLFLEKINNNILPFKKEKILLGLSGGADSVSVALAFKELGISFSCAHLNHGTREQTKSDEDFCRDFCKKNNLKLFTKKIKPNKSSEEYLRGKRHKFLQNLRKNENFDKIALAHNKDDFLEQIFLFLLRGVGDFHFRERFKAYDEKFLRPVFNIPREKIIDFLKKKKQGFVEDESNFKSNYRRNFLRLKIIPKLKKEFPSLEKVLFRNAEIFSLNADFVAESSNKFLEKNFQENILDLKKFSKLHQAEKLFISKKLFTEETSSKRVFELKEFLEDKNSSGKIKIGEGLHLVKSGLKAKLVRGKEEIPKVIKLKTNTKNIFGPYEIYLEKIKNRWEMGDGRWEMDCCGCAAKLLLHDEVVQHPSSPIPHPSSFVKRLLLNAKNIFVRTRKKGDIFRPSGIKGRKKLQDFFVDEKIPSFSRDTFPIFVDEKDRILAVGSRVSELGKVTGSEDEVFCVCF